MFLTIETNLDMIGDRDPDIRVALRDYPHVQGQGRTNRLEVELWLTVAERAGVGVDAHAWADARLSRTCRVAR